MIRHAALAGAAACLFAFVPAVAAEAPPQPLTELARPSVTALPDGFLRHDPSGLRLPREIAGPSHTHLATLTAVEPDKVALTYGPITVTIGAPMAMADPNAVPPGWKADPAAPSLPSLLFWGEAAAPLTVSFLRDANAGDWISFSIVTRGWQIELSALYPPASRDTVLRTAEAVWAILASANAEAPKPPPAP